MARRRRPYSLFESIAAILLGVAAVIIKWRAKKERTAARRPSRGYGAGDTKLSPQASRYNSYVRELAGASLALFGFLRELNRSTRCRNLLKSLPGMECFDGEDGTFTINKRLAVIAYCDVRDCFRRLGYDEGELQGLTGIGYAMFVMLLINRDFDLMRFLDVKQRGRLLEIVSELKNTTSVEMNIADHEDEFRFNVLFGIANGEHEWTQQFATHLYRWASLVAKSDGVVTADESATLAAILEMRKSGDGANIRVSGGRNESPPGESSPPQRKQRKEDVQTLKEVMQSLDALIGLDPVKTEVKSLSVCHGLRKPFCQ